MYVYIYIYMCVYIYSIYIYIQIYMYICIHRIYKHVCVCVRMCRYIIEEPRKLDRQLPSYGKEPLREVQAKAATILAAWQLIAVP